MLRVRTYAFQLLAISMIALLSGCEKDEAKEAPTPKAGDGLTLIDFGHAQVKVELAANQITQARGLMFRESMPEDQGMLFVFDRPKSMSFWMRNTNIPLDIGYFTADGVLREVYPLYPHDETSRKSIRSDLLYALEVNQGWFKRHGIKPGDAFDLSVLR